MTNDYGNLELHKVLLFTMKEIHKICIENGLRYYLHAGTLLGAINYEGFIPWDDDVDISLFRDDYNKLIEIIIEQYKDTFFVQNYHTDAAFTNNRTIIRVLGTNVSHNNEYEDEIHNEIGIDLVPLDNVPDSVVFRKIQKSLIWVLDAAVQIKLKRIIPRSFPMKCIGVISKMKREQLGLIIDRITTFFNYKTNTKYVGLLSYTGNNPYTGRSGYDNDTMLRKWFESPIMVNFEGEKFMTISEPAVDLDHRYGKNWRKPYPEEKRVTKHDVNTYSISSNVRKKLGIEDYFNEETSD